MANGGRVRVVLGRSPRTSAAGRNVSQQRRFCALRSRRGSVVSPSSTRRGSPPSITEHKGTDMSQARKATFSFTKLIVEDLEKMASFYHAVYGLNILHRVQAHIGAEPISEIMMGPGEQ